jgi:hypothetical protein
MRELSDQGSEGKVASARRSIVDPGELRPRTPMPLGPSMAGLTPIPPDAVVPASEESDLTEIDAPIGPVVDARFVADPSIPIEIGSVVSAPVAEIRASSGVDDPAQSADMPSHTPMSSVASPDPVPVPLDPPAKKARWSWLAALSLVGALALYAMASGSASPPAAVGHAPDPAALPPAPEQAPTVAAQASAKDAGSGGHVETAAP